MNSAVIAIAGLAAFIVAYRFYARHLATRVFGLEGTDQEPTPAHELQDDVDFVPTRPLVLFGHHFASIAGLAPIAGPAIAIIWGWVPALVWVVLGSILLGAVHDYAAIAISLKHKGKSIGDLTGVILGPRGRVLFLVVIFFLLALAMGIFALLVAQIFTSQYPQTVIPVFALIFVAAGMGYSMYRFSLKVLPATILGLALTFFSVWVGINHPVNLHKVFMTREVAATILSSGKVPAGSNVTASVALLQQEGLNDAARGLQDAANSAVSAWVYVLLAYAFAASILPVWLLLQPRDYLNSFQLYIGIGALFVGLVLSHLAIVAPAFHQAEGTPSFFPLLFITIACGAISGFHGLVSSGTTARQLDHAADARPIAYGGMLVEALLALIAILACAAGVGTFEKWSQFYPGYQHVSGSLANQLTAFFYGAGTFLAVFHIPRTYGQAVVAVIVVGFAMTTLDTGARLLRYNIEELADTFNMKKYVNRFLASLLAAVVLGFVALLKVPASGPGGTVVYKPAGLVVWQLFGTANQLLACLGLLVVTVYLVKVGKPSYYTSLPFAFMLLVSGWSLVERVVAAWSPGNPDLRSWPVLVVGLILVVVTVWLAVEAVVTLVRVKAARAKAQAA